MEWVEIVILYLKTTSLHFYVGTYEFNFTFFGIAIAVLVVEFGIWIVAKIVKG